MEILGYIAAALIGISLGLIGGGGSILTIPVLVYIFHIDPTLATSYSLFIVGVTSLAGAYSNYRKGYASISLALPLGIVSPFTVFITRRFLLPLVPQELFSIGDWVVTRSLLTMVLFAILMLAASISMLTSKGLKERMPGEKSEGAFGILILYGIGIGLVTGFLGAGGGFLIIPALVIFLHLSMKEAVGTSLFIIAVNSLIGFLGDLGHYTLNWQFLLLITAIAMAGIITGGMLSKTIPGHKLKKGFGWFVLVMGCYIILKELFL
ncbi:MAG: sulfite exporter TauE/SafE family protein [Chitinophagaceae bacterium]